MLAAFTFTVGILTAYVERWINRSPCLQSARDRLMLFGLPTVVVLFIALMLYATNQPSELSREIPITYLLHRKTGRLPQHLRIDNGETLSCNLATTQIWRQFKNQDSKNAAKVALLLEKDHWSKGAPVISNLTEYVVLYCMGIPGGASETNFFRGTSPERMAFPHPTISGLSMSLEEIRGSLKENPFYGLSSSGPEPKIALPRRTRVWAQRESDRTSVIVFENNYMTLKITTHVLVDHFGEPVFPDYSNFLPPEPFGPRGGTRIEEERKGPFWQFRARIFVDVSFDRFRYGFPEMAHYKAWAANLTDSLERKFAWGEPVLVDLMDVLGR